jgi:hypothetical protein
VPGFPLRCWLSYDLVPQAILDSPRGGH